MYKVEIPRENANDDNVTITAIHVKNHQEVKKSDTLFEFETSKTVIEVESEKDTEGDDMDDMDDLDL